MKEHQLLEKLHQMPEALQNELLHYAEFLLNKYQQEKKGKKKPVFGSMKGTFKMSEDFDEPLEDFKDYMP